MPTKNHACNYAAAMHFLKAMTQARTDEPLAVKCNARAAGRLLRPPGHAAADGRQTTDLVLYRVKHPDESHAPWGLLHGDRQSPGRPGVPADESCLHLM